MIMYNEKPDVSGFQQFGCEGWLHRRVDQRPDSKFDASGEPVIFVGYTPNQKGFLLWCPESRKVSCYGIQNVVLILWWFPTMLFLGTTALDQSTLLLNFLMNQPLMLNYACSTYDAGGSFDVQPAHCGNL